MDSGVREYEKVIDSIMDQIQSRRLKIGSILPSERQMSSDLAISRNSVREGLRVLGNMGLVKSRQGSGNFISADMSRSFISVFNMMLMLRVATLKEITDFRKGIEWTLSELAFHNSDKADRLREMEGVLACVPGSSAEDQIALDYHFHLLLAAMANNAILSVIMNSVSSVYETWIADVIHSASPEERLKLHLTHAQIYDSLVSRNKEAGFAAVADHYDIVDAVAVRAL